MLTLGTGLDSKASRNRLKRLFRDAVGSKPMRRRLTTPGGAIDNALVYWVPLENNRGIWGHFWNLANLDDNRWGCWFGVHQGQTDSEALVPAVEINLPTNAQYDLTIAGRILIDEDRRRYLGHRGGLGGGRYSVSRLEFAQAIRGFVEEEFLKPEQLKSEMSYVVGAIDDPDLIQRMHDYVSECYRIRELRRDEVTRRNHLPRGKDRNKVNIPSKKQVEFNPEASADGIGSGSGEWDIARLHGKVVNKLHTEVPGSVNSSHNGMRPDLYVPSRRGMSVLFEVKSSSTTRDWFTAIGQLLVYSGRQEPQPRLVFVCPAERKDPSFRDALTKLGIHLVSFVVDGPDVNFVGLNDALRDIPDHNLPV